MQMGFAKNDEGKSIDFGLAMKMQDVWAGVSVAHDTEKFTARNIAMRYNMEFPIGMQVDMMKKAAAMSVSMDCQKCKVKGTAEVNYCWEKDAEKTLHGMPMVMRVGGSWAPNDANVMNFAFHHADSNSMKMSFAHKLNDNVEVTSKYGYDCADFKHAMGFDVSYTL